MLVACLDLEGVLIPEIWINVAEHSGVAELTATTRDVPDYDELMRFRLDALRRNGIGLPDIQAVIAGMEPLPGAATFLDDLRRRFQVIVLSDTFYEFAMPLMARLGWPTLFCHHLVADDEGTVTAYRLRLRDPKRKAVEALHGLNFKVLAAGDSYNDISMLREADAGILFRPPANVAAEHPAFVVTNEYPDLAAAFAEAAEAVGAADAVKAPPGVALPAQ